jgi:hypothetical protein
MVGQALLLLYSSSLAVCKKESFQEPSSQLVMVRHKQMQMERLERLS